MPAKSAAQERLMQAAAHTPGGYGGVPQSVGKEFVRDDAMTEWDAIQAVRSGAAPSPSRYGGMWLFKVRVTGTGISFRPQLDEWVYRPPEYYLNAEFLERIKGLPVLLMHTEQGDASGKEYQDRNIGVLVSPWVQDSAVWGIAKIYTDQDAALIIEYFPSTSPSVFIDVDEQKDYVRAPDGKRMLVEGKPGYIDHLAIVPQGVWDKFGPPTGVEITA